MPKNDEGEFELILGNRQLLSVFFIVVILLGVFFTMGYIVGRNSGPLTADVTQKDVAQKTDAAPMVVDAPSRPAESAVPPPAPAPTEPPQPVSTQPQRPAADTTPAPPPAPARTETVRNVPSKPAAGNEPAAGQSYLQLAATSKREADIMVDVLRQKGFQSLAAEITEKPGTFRVLVGPVTDATANKTRADLQGAGFPGNASIRRTF